MVLWRFVLEHLAEIGLFGCWIALVVGAYEIASHREVVATTSLSYASDYSPRLKNFVKYRNLVLLTSTLVFAAYIGVIVPNQKSIHTMLCGEEIIINPTPWNHNISPVGN